MQEIEFFIQVEGREGMQSTKVPSTHRWSEVVDHVLRVIEISTPHAAVVLIEDGDVDIPAETVLEELAGLETVLRLHVHRCHHIEVKVSYNAHTISRAFKPSATISKVKAWVGEQFKIGAGDLAELVLEIVGTNRRPDGDTHIGTLTSHPNCALPFNLVFSKRVHG